MADSTRPSQFPWWVNLADGATLALVAASGLIACTGGFRHDVAGVFVSATSAWRPLLAAALITAFRHLACPRVHLGRRLVTAGMRCIRRLQSLGFVAWAITVRAAAIAVRSVARVAQTLAPEEGVFHPGSSGVTSGTPIRELAVVALLMAALTVLMLRDQVRHLDQVPDLGDPLFSIWRLSWIAHQLPRDPLHLFDGNVFFPERGTLAFSDSILLPGLAGAPLSWLGVRAVQFYNLYVMATFVLAGVAMYVFVRALTRQRAAALVAGVIFAFYPFRFEHYSHFELHFSFWMPLVLLALHRTLAAGRVRDGLLTGAAFAGQMLSCAYFGIFLAVYMVPIWLVLAVGWRRVRSSIPLLLAGGALAAVLVAPMVVAHFDARQVVGNRSPDEVKFYSARTSDYLTPHPTSTTYADVLRRHPRPERDLFPGLLVLALAAVALWPPLSASRIAYAIGLVFAFEASLGFNGFIYSALYRWVLPFRGLRVPARCSMLVGLSLSILAGYGVARLVARFRHGRARTCLAAVLIVIVLFESRATLGFESVYTPHPVYRWFHGRPTAVIVDLPGPGDFRPRDAVYMYWSTTHWQRLVNGYSGFVPPESMQISETLATFPDEASIRLLRQIGVEYVVLHEMFYGHLPFGRVVAAVEQRTDFREVHRARVGNAESRIYRLLR